MRFSRRPRARFGVLAVLLSTLSSGQVPGVAGDHSTTWRASFTQPMNRVATTPVRDVTCREIVRPRAAGTQVRVHLSNVLGIRPIELSAVTVGLRSRGAGLTGTPAAVTVGGLTTMRIAPGKELLSDPIPLPVRAGADLAVSFAVRGKAFLPEHSYAAATSWCSRRGAGDLTGRVDAAGFPLDDRSGLLVSGVDVSGEAPQDAPSGASLVAVGDSLTDAPLPPDTYNRWTDAIAPMLPGTPVVNAAIAGNRVVQSGGYGPTLRERFDGDVLLQAGVDTVVVLAGTNDISTGVSAERLQSELEALVVRGQQAGLRIVLATIPPAARRTAAERGVRDAVNSWIRNRSRADLVVDADRALRDPTAPGRLLSRYDHGDGLHLSPAGHAALARAVADVVR